ncbi:MAG: iron ABC transporter substrate-binding protein [Thermoplasmatota archaeon]
MRPGALALLLLLLVPPVLVPGCIDDESGPTRTIIDMLGREVKVPVEIESVVGVEAGALRLLVYMDHTDKVVGIEEHEKSSGAGGNAKPYIFANPELLELPSIGPMHGGDAELIVSRGPDVIFWTYTDTSRADDLQEKCGIPVIALDYGDLNENRETLFDALHLIGEIMGNEERALEVQEFFEERIRELDDMTRELKPRPRCYVGGIGHRGAHGLLSTEPSYSSLKFINQNNVASSLGMEHAFIDKEKIIEWDPEVLLIDEGGLSIAEKDLKSGIYDTVEAVSEGRIYCLLPYNWYTTNYGTVLGNSYYIASLLFSEEIGEIDPVEETGDIYEFLVGKRVYEEMAEEFGGFKELEI